MVSDTIFSRDMILKDGMCALVAISENNVFHHNKDCDYIISSNIYKISFVLPMHADLLKEY